ncbi:MAG TPA: hypothetical protein VFR80_11210 [Pyrinomonadaceae bacterium]|nr:hypothetical protein [Pyrinomonadaceae bacterium]
MATTSLPGVFAVAVLLWLLAIPLLVVRDFLVATIAPAFSDAASLRVVASCSCTGFVLAQPVG